MLLPLGTMAQTAYDYSRLQRERLNRGTVAVRTSPDSVLVSWRYLECDPIDVTFEILRNGKLIGRRHQAESTTFMDYYPASEEATYTVRPVYANGNLPAELRTTDLPLLTSSWTLPAHAPFGYLDIPLNPPSLPSSPTPPSSTVPSPSSSVSAGFPGGSVTYHANDATMADLDGDGQLEIILKWDPSNSRDNSHSGITSPTILEALRLDGTSLWRVNLGPNIRSGAHYTPFIVADLNGDGCAELLVRTSDGTIDGQGNILGDPKADHVRRPDHEAYQANNNPNEQFRGPGWPNNMDPKARRGGFIYKGPEWVTCFDGRTGRALSTMDYIPERGEIRAWGDNYANRSDRFLAACGYLDGQHLSAIFCRGYYTRTVLAAYDFDGKQLSLRWVFDTNDPDKRRYAGQGNHNLRVADVDGDGCDEITYGSMAVDHDGTPLYNTGFGHGDAIHLTAFFPPTASSVPDGFPADNALQVWDCHENKRDGSDFRDARTGKVLFQLLSPKDVGRCMAADIDPTNPGLEMWSSASGGICNVRGEVIDSTARIPINFGIWWDGDLLRELLDHEAVSKYRHPTSEPSRTGGPLIPSPASPSSASSSSEPSRTGGPLIPFPASPSSASSTSEPSRTGGPLIPSPASPSSASSSSASPSSEPSPASSAASVPSLTSPLNGDKARQGYNGDSQEGEAGKGHYDFSGSSSCPPIVKFDDCAFNNGTKSNPALCADVIGDWREEVLTRTKDNRHLRLYISPLPTPYRFHTFLADPVYRHSVTMQNVGYNQPTNVGFYFGAELQGSGRLLRGWQF